MLYGLESAAGSLSIKENYKLLIFYLPGRVQIRNKIETIATHNDDDGFSLFLLCMISTHSLFFHLIFLHNSSAYCHCYCYCYPTA